MKSYIVAIISSSILFPVTLIVGGLFNISTFIPCTDHLVQNHRTKYEAYAALSTCLYHGT